MRVTNSSEFDDKLKAARIAYFDQETWALKINMVHGRPFGRGPFVLSTICILLLDDKKQTKEEEKKRSMWVRQACKEKETRILPSTSDRNFSH